MDAKRRELVGEPERRARVASQGQAPQVNTHDFPSHAKGKTIPDGVYDLARKEGWISVGVARDTAQYAVASIAAWWEQLGRGANPDAGSLTITADSGGSNSARGRPWKVELQKLSDPTGLEIVVCHFPRGTSKVEPNRAPPIQLHQPQLARQTPDRPRTIINLIKHHHQHRLNVYARLDETEYLKGVTVSDAEIAQVDLHRLTSTAIGTTPSSRTNRASN